MFATVKVYNASSLTFQQNLGKERGTQTIPESIWRLLDWILSSRGSRSKMEPGSVRHTLRSFTKRKKPRDEEGALKSQQGKQSSKGNMLKVAQGTSEPEKWGAVLTFIRCEQPGFFTAQHESLHEAPMTQPKVRSHMAAMFSSLGSPTPNTPVLHPRTDSICSSSRLRTPESSWEMTEMLLFKTVLSL